MGNTSHIILADCVWCTVDGRIAAKLFLLTRRQRQVGVANKKKGSPRRSLFAALTN